jgi:hypothetical protein
MLYIILALAAALLILQWLAPRSYLVHAGVADGDVPSDQPTWVRWTSAGLIRDERGARIDLRDAFYGIVKGPSMKEKGLTDGAQFVGQRLDIYHPPVLKAGDIVVAKEFDLSVGPEKYCYCLRSIRAVEDNQVQYEDSIHGQHGPHPFEQVIARVTYVLDPPTSGGGIRSFMGTA